ncbi:MAG: preprotein translocase subunit SecG [Gemmatimonadales bacterium]
MHGLILLLLVIDALLLCLVVLLQAGKGSGLAAEFGGASSSTDSFLGGRQTATLLTKSSWTLGGIFMGLSLVLAIVSARSRAPTSILEGQMTAPATQQEVPTSVLQREGQAPPEGVQPGTQESGGQGGGEEQTIPPEGGN